MTDKRHEYGVTRRHIALGCAGLALAQLSGRAKARQLQGLAGVRPYSYKFVDYWSPAEIRRRERQITISGTKPSLREDIAAAEAIIAAAPKDTPLSIMKYFAGLTAVGSTGEPFNRRWKTYENPVIVWFFHATDQKPTGDCTSWCAAFMSWSLERAGVKSMLSVSSQDYAFFGTKTTSPVPGDIVVFQSVSDPAHGHVALFLDQTNTTIHFLDGNQGDGGAIPSCPKGYPISGIGEDTRPKKDSHQFLRTIRHY